MDRMNKYFTISQMPIVSSNYWNGVHGNTAEEVKNDFEGLQTMRILARNMAWLIKSIEAGKKGKYYLSRTGKKDKDKFHKIKKIPDFINQGFFSRADKSSTSIKHTLSLSMNIKVFSKSIRRLANIIRLLSLESILYMPSQ